VPLRIAENPHAVPSVPEGLIAVNEYDFDSLTYGPDLRYVSRPVFKLICRAIADQDRHTPRIDHTTTSAATYRDCTKPGHGPQEIDLGEVADGIYDRSGAAATGGVPSLMEQLAAARRPGCLDKAGTTLGTPSSARHQAAIPAASLSSIGGNVRLVLDED